MVGAQIQLVNPLSASSFFRASEVKPSISGLTKDLGNTLPPHFLGFGAWFQHGMVSVFFPGQRSLGGLIDFFLEDGLSVSFTPSASAGKPS